jgi:hypothetical protein
MQSCINFGICLVEGRVPKACSSRVQKHVSVVSKVLRLTWLPEHAFGTLPSTKKSAKINAGLRPVAATRAVNQRPGGRAKAKAGRQAGAARAGGRGAAQNPARLFFQLPYVSSLQALYIYVLSSLFYAINAFPENDQSSTHVEG